MAFQVVELPQQPIAAAHAEAFFNWLSADQRSLRVAPVSVENLIHVTRMRTTLEIAALRLALAPGARDWEGAIVSAEDRL